MPSKNPMPAELLARVARTFQVLGDPSRLEILQTLMAGPRSVTAIVQATGKSQANVSKHLAVLAAAGLVSRTPNGNLAIYEVADPLVYKLCDLVCGSIRVRMGEQIKVQQRLLRRV